MKHFKVKPVKSAFEKRIIKSVTDYYTGKSKTGSVKELLADAGLKP